MKKPVLFFIMCITTSIAFAQLKTDSVFHPQTIQQKPYFPIQPVPSNYYSSHAGFFCKKEIQIQKATKIPVRCRLGSVAYCDAIEGKPNTLPVQ